MIKPGICSVTFRSKSPEEIISLCTENQLLGIEWAADAHVPPNDLANARRIGELTRQAGLQVAGYGSYFLAFEKEGEPASAFEPILDAAIELGAPIIRIWGGALGRERTPEYFAEVVQRCRQAASAAAGHGIGIALEFHRNTYTETLQGALELLNAVDHPNLKMYWQPVHGSTLQERLTEIAAFNRSLLGVHVFHWDGTEKPPYPRFNLSEGKVFWLPCLRAIHQQPADLFALLEFVRADSTEQFHQDAQTLVSWLEELRS